MPKKIVFLLIAPLLLLACAIPQYLLPQGVRETPGFLLPTSSERATIRPLKSTQEAVSATMTPTDRPFKASPTPSVDPRFLPGTATVANASVSVVEGSHAQFQVDFDGQLPSACYQLRVKLNQPDEVGHILITVSSVLDPGKMCAEGEVPFAATLRLPKLKSGAYTVTVGEKKAGDVTVP
jgi:hypothetical protein